MCGIYGWQWRKDRKPSQQQRVLLAVVLGTLNDNRGGDSWGWYSLMTNSFNKGMGDVAAEARHAAHHDSILCHTRKATTGAKTVENAHPWKFGKIIGAHNGVVYNHEDLCKEREKLEVDSMHIFKGLDNGTGLNGIRGYGSIEWTDASQDAGEINLLRTTTSSDLGVVELPCGVVWSSSCGHLRTALKISGLCMEDNKVIEIVSEKVHKVKNGKIFLTDKEMTFMSYNAKPSSVYGSQMGFRGRSWHRGQGWVDDEFGPFSDPDPTPPFRVTNKVRKTIGREAPMLPSGGVAYICRSCYREVDLQRKCPRGHTEGVLVMKEAQ